MSKPSVDQLIGHAKLLLGAPYVYGYKGQVASAEGIKALAKAYPGVFSASYIKKAKARIGKRCYDCSGLIATATHVIRGSIGYFNSAEKRVKINGPLSDKYRGWILWHPGHVGIYAGNDVCYEARGIDYGVVKTKASTRGFKYLLKCPDIDYTVAAEPKPAIKPAPKKIIAKKVVVKPLYVVKKYPHDFDSRSSVLHIRSKPTIKGKVIGHLSQGVSFTSTKKKGRWLYVNTEKGWVSSDYCKKM